MRIIPTVSAVIADGMISLTPGSTIDLPDAVAGRLVDAGLATIEAEPVKTPRKKVAEAPENKAG